MSFSLPPPRWLGTRALGQLALVTLLIAMFGSLLLLPALLLSFDTKEPQRQSAAGAAGVVI
ncbi:MAG: hypothetical protein R3B47_03055 [Bacteroidia bacterium]